MRGALAPSGADRGRGLGARLADLLTTAERNSVDVAGDGASVEQLQRAEAAVRAGVAGGTVRSLAGLAVALGRKAARGEVGEIGEVATVAAAGAAQPNPWPAREQCAGWTVQHQRGTLVVQPGAQQFRHCGGDRDGHLVGGLNATAVWQRIDSGELALQPPTPP